MAAKGYSMEIKVGALILVSLVILVGFIFMLGDFRFTERSLLYVDFPTSADLKTGAPVKVTGVTVGKVEAVDLWGGKPDPAHSGKIVYVRVTLKVDKNVPGLLHKDARFYITTLGALGEKYVEIDPGSPDEPTLQNGALAEGLGPLRLEILGANAGSILNQIEKILRENRANVRDFIANLKDVSSRVNEMLVENRDELREAIAKAHETMAHLSKLSGALEKAIGSGRDVKQLIVSTRRVARALETRVAPALDRFPRVAKKVEDTVDELHGLLSDGRRLVRGSEDDVRATLANARKVSQEVKDGKGSIGALLTDRELYDDIVEIIKDIKRHPWKVLWKE